MTGPASWQERAREALSFLSRPGTRHGRNIDRDPRVAAAVYSWPGPDGGNLGPQITGHAVAEGDASGGWQRYTVRPAEVWCFDSRTDHQRHQINL